MKCYRCNEEASTKIGTSEGSLLNALLGRKCWNKTEIYLCKTHYDIHQEHDMRSRQTASMPRFTSRQNAGEERKEKEKQYK